MASLQSSKLHDQRGLLCKENLELPDFLKIENANNNNNSNRLSRVTNYDSDSSVSATSCGHPASLRGDTGGRRRSKSSDRKLFVELNSRPSSLSTFKPNHVTRSPVMRDSGSSSDDVTDLTIVDDVTLDLDLTLVPLPTPPQQVRGFDLPMPDYSPPTPIHRK